MRKITITGPAGEKLAGQLPEHWGEVGLGKYGTLAAAARPVPASIEPTVHPFANPAGCQALATLLGLPSAEPLLADMSLMLVIYEAAPWLFAGPLPPATEPVTDFEHQGIWWAYQGGLEKASGGQWEALMQFLAAHEGNPMGAGPGLLAVLYAPAGQQQTPEVVRDAAKAFESLPMSIAWPCLQRFFFAYSNTANTILKYSVLRPQVIKLLDSLEAPLQTSAQPGFYSNTLRRLVLRWTSRARKMLATS